MGQSEAKAEPLKWMPPNDLMLSMQTPRLCIDGRIASEFPEKGLVVQELIDQLVAANGEPGIQNEWIEKRRTVLLCHPDQIFSGQLKRFDTKKTLGRGPLKRIWEKGFVKHSGISLFHRFRPVDKVLPSYCSPTLTTLLPPTRSLPFFLSRGFGHYLVVPSQADAQLLQRRYNFAADHIFSVVPTVRRYMHFTETPRPSVEGWILFVVSSRAEAKELKRLLNIVSQRFPGTPHKILRLDQNPDLSPPAWTKLMTQTKILFYLAARPFDWATLALESIFWGIPTVFSDEHAALGEQLPHSPLKLSSFLIELKELAELRTLTQQARDHLRKQEVYDPYFAAKQYSDIYRRLPITDLSPYAEAKGDPSCCTPPIKQNLF